jgi:dienelactone hydrolase
MHQVAVQIPTDTVLLDGDLTIPDGSQGMVLFAHGSGSSRLSARNRYVAQVLYQAGLSTLLMDLLTREEDRVDTQTQRLRFDMHLLALRLIAAIDWLSGNPLTENLRVGLFGASTGAGAALVAAAERSTKVEAVVSRGGRPDLAGEALGRVSAPTLLIVGGYDAAVVQVNQGALAVLRGPKALEIIPGATHLFEEPGTLEQAAGVARDWFVQYLAVPSVQEHLS